MPCCVFVGFVRRATRDRLLGLFLGAADSVGLPVGWVRGGDLFIGFFFFGWEGVGEWVDGLGRCEAADVLLWGVRQVRE